MANISDTAGIFTGGVLEAFTEMERVVGRDGDVAAAQVQMLEAMRKVTVTQQVSTSGSGGSYTRRKA